MARSKQEKQVSEADVTFFNFLYRNGLWVSVPLFAVALLSLIYFIKAAIRLRVDKQILSVPLAAEQSIEFMEAGQVILCIEGPHFTSRFAQMGFDLPSNEGMHVKGRSVLLRARSSGISQVRTEIIS